MLSFNSESVKELLSCLIKIEAKLARYEKALQFYADKKNYGFVSTGEGDLDFGCPINDDSGATAREALEAKE